ncbi:MAG: type II secretion system protein [Chthoniobacterales bacterium]
MYRTSCCPPRIFIRAFTLVELLAVVSIIAVLAVLLFPAIEAMAKRAHLATCINNLKTICAASASYSSDHNGNWPRSQTGKAIFSNDLVSYLGNIPGRGDSNFKKSPFICPAANSHKEDGGYMYEGIYTPGAYVNPATGKTVRYGLSYAQNVYADRTQSNYYGVPKRSAAENPSKMMLYMDCVSHYIVSLGGIKNEDRKVELLERHNGLINTAFADGSVRSLKYEDIPGKNSPVHLFWSGRGKSWPED